jgi:hypothetical protein
MNAFWASEKADAFMVSAPSQPGKSQRKTLTSGDPVFGEQISFPSGLLLQAVFIGSVARVLIVDRHHFLPGSGGGS